MLQPQPFTPTIVQIVPPPTPDVGVLDVLVGSLGLTGVIILGSIVLGGALGVLMIGYRKWRENHSDAAGISPFLSAPAEAAEEYAAKTDRPRDVLDDETDQQHAADYHA